MSGGEELAVFVVDDALEERFADALGHCPVIWPSTIIG